MASRAGLSREVDLLVKTDTVLPADAFDGCQCVLVDEAQFMSSFIIDQLREIASTRGVPVICYGLRNDFRSSLRGEQAPLRARGQRRGGQDHPRLLQQKAVFNLKSIDGEPTISGAQVTLGAEEMYLPACPVHFYGKLKIDSVELNSTLKAMHQKEAADAAAAAAAAAAVGAKVGEESAATTTATAESSSESSGNTCSRATECVSPVAH